jgi:catechol 2,3-dioxygenase-like lactoylglutathione lyase family enzyme
VGGFTGEGGIMKLELDHIVLAVRRMDEMLRFYLDVVGLAPHRVDEYRSGAALFPCARINAATIVDLLPPALWGGDDASAAMHHNLNHFCIAFEREEWEPLMARLAAAGIDIEAGPMTLSGARGDGISVYVRDPDANRVELRYYDAVPAGR